MIYMMIAGEASGDMHAAQLMKAIRRYDAKAQFVFFGGDNMAEAAGREPVVHIREMAYMGFSEVVRNLGKIRHNLQLAKTLLRKVNPDCLILVDYPSFNLKVADAAKSAGIKVFYYISPKVWAWKEWRVRTLKRVVDRMFVILPFEKGWYRDAHQWDVTYVGNPTVAEIDDAMAAAPDFQDFVKAYGLRDKPILALLPGSRRGEIKNNLPVMLQASRRFVQYQAVIAGAPGIDEDFYREYTALPVIYDDRMALLHNSRAAMVTSGTATLECAIAGVPQVACYRSNGRKVAYDIMKKVLSVPYVTLPNLIAGREVIPELLLHMCTPDAVGEALSPLMSLTGARRQAMLDDYAEVRKALGEEDAADNAARHMVADLENNRNLYSQSGQ
ncbi:MAG: lipid-A-disaccharide synthase [Muribaculaceae bacterium]|nr:lipid-A-disaccharide synthase [Muribaculaceae bacterium]